MEVISVYDINREKYLNFPTSCTVGRKGSDINFPYDTKLSRVHCQFLVKDGIFYVQDLGATNTFKVDNEKFNAHDIAEIKKGQVLEIGKQKFKFIMLKVGKMNVSSLAIADFEEEEIRNIEEQKTQMTLIFNTKKEAPTLTVKPQHDDNTNELKLLKKEPLQREKKTSQESLSKKHSYHKYLMLILLLALAFIYFFKKL